MKRFEKKQVRRLFFGFQQWVFAVFCFAALEGAGNEFHSNLLYGLRYTITTERSSLESRHAYPDDEKKPKLTDGVLTKNHWSEKKAVGWQASQGNIAITFALSKPVSPLVLRCHALGGGSGGVFFPKSIRVFGINEGKPPQMMGATTDHPVETQKKMDAAWIIVDLLADAEYSAMMIEVTPGKGMVMLDEIELYRENERASDNVTRPTPVVSRSAPEFCARQVFQTKPAEYSITNIYSFYPEKLVPISGYRTGICYLGATGLWPAELHMQKIREFGFNIVHGEGQTANGGMRWGSIQLAPNEYDWRALDKFVQNAFDAGLYAVISTDAGSSTPPAWILRDYPDAAFINPHGEAVPGIIDYGHPDVLRVMKNFLSAVARRYRDYPNIASYYIADELSLYRNYYHLKNLGGQNFNARMCRAFFAYLAKKYSRVEDFNARAGRSYAAFCDVRPCLSWIETDDYGAEWIEWCRFRTAESGRIYREMYNAIKQEMPSVPVGLSSVILAGYLDQGVDPADCEFIDFIGDKLFLSDRGNTRGWVSFALSGQLKNRKFSAANLAYGIPSKIAKKDGWEAGYTNSPHTYIRGAFELAGANVDTVLHWSWDAARRYSTDAYNYPHLLYIKNNQYMASSSVENLGSLMPFFGKYGNLIREARPFSRMLGGLDSVTSSCHQRRKRLAVRLKAGDRYARGAYGITPPTYDSRRKLLMELSEINGDCSFFTRLPPRDELAAFKAFSLVGASHLSDEDVAALADYAGRGGALIVDRETAKFDDCGRPRNPSAVPFMDSRLDNVCLFDPARTAKNEPLRKFLKNLKIEPKARVEPSTAPIGVHAMRIETPGVKGVMFLVVNRGGEGARCDDVRLSVDKTCLPQAPFYVYTVDPCPLLVEKETQGKEDGDFKLPVGSLSDAKAVFILDKKMDEALGCVQTAQILPRYKRVPWWDKRRTHRLPVTCYQQGIGPAMAFDLDLNEACARIGLSRLPDLSTLSLVKHENDASVVIPITIMDGNSGKNDLRISFRDDQAFKRRPAETYYLYMNSKPVDRLDMGNARLSGQWFVMQANGLVVVQRSVPTGVRADVLQTDQGVSVGNIPVPGDGMRVFLKAKGANGRYSIRVNGRRIDREFCDYERMIYLADLSSGPKDKLIEIGGDHFNELMVSAIIFAAKNDRIDKLAETVEAMTRHDPGSVEIGLMETLR
ncbi:MAG: beta-galactosidase [Verrucomicrobiae bacterium]|nr:beta-galactosidase [Verrucomicrobiae bacterium]